MPARLSASAVLHVANLPRLYTFALSHYSEKARWALDAAGLVYDEHPQTPLLHIPNIIRLSKNKTKTSVPLLIDGETRLQESTAIMLWAHDKAPEKGLFGEPAKPGRTGKVTKAAAAKAEKQRADIEATIAHFDGMGHHVRRFCYGYLLSDRKQVLLALTWASAPLQSAALKLNYPLVKAGITKAYDISPESTERSRAIIETKLKEIAKRVKKTAYLCGKEFSAADIAVASLLAPIAMPDESPIYRTLRGNAAAPIAELSQHAAMDWVRDIYRNHRVDDVV